jgi:hypothetical protein
MRAWCAACRLRGPDQGAGPRALPWWMAAVPVEGCDAGGSSVTVMLPAQGGCAGQCGMVLLTRTLTGTVAGDATGGGCEKRQKSRASAVRHVGMHRRRHSGGTVAVVVMMCLAVCVTGIWVLRAKVVAMFMLMAWR